MRNITYLTPWPTDRYVPRSCDKLSFPYASVSNVVHVGCVVPGEGVVHGGNVVYGEDVVHAGRV